MGGTCKARRRLSSFIVALVLITGISGMDYVECNKGTAHGARSQRYSPIMALGKPAYNVTGHWIGEKAFSDGGHKPDISLHLVMSSTGGLTGTYFHLGEDYEIEGAVKNTTIQFVCETTFDVEYPWDGSRDTINTVFYFSGTLSDPNNMSGVWEQHIDDGFGTVFKGTWEASKAVSVPPPDEPGPRPIAPQIKEVFVIIGDFVIDIVVAFASGGPPIPTVIDTNLYHKLFMAPVDPVRLIADGVYIQPSEVENLKFEKVAEVSSETEEYTIKGLTQGVKYYIAMTSVDEDGRESDLSSNIVWVDTGTGETGELDPISWGPERVAEPETDSSSSGCFIATAAYGSGMSSEVVSLRAFRDVFLLGNRAGRAFTAAYYSASPALAEGVAENKALRLIIRAHLTPIVKAAEWLLN